jgi:hypothetical protein
VSFSAKSMILIDREGEGVPSKMEHPKMENRIHAPVHCMKGITFEKI